MKKIEKLTENPKKAVTRSSRRTVDKMQSIPETPNAAGESGISKLFKKFVNFVPKCLTPRQISTMPTLQKI